MDICLITIDKNLNKSLQPKSVFGILWLQTHFDNDQWEALSNSTVIISEENSHIFLKKNGSDSASPRIPGRIWNYDIDCLHFWWILAPPGDPKNHENS